MAIDDFTFNLLGEIAKWELPNLAKRDDDGNVVRFATGCEVVGAAMDVAEKKFPGVYTELTLDDITSDDFRHIVECYRSTHITAAG